MSIEERVILAQSDKTIREDLIFEYKNYIYSCAHKSLGRYVTEQDDEMSIAMIAFNEAISKYEQSRGPFLNYANLIIKNRLIDYLRKEFKSSNIIPFSALAKTDKDGEEKPFDVEDVSTNYNDDAKYELEALTQELKKQDISFFELTKFSPKSKKTKSACFEVIKYIVQTPSLVNEIKSNGVISIKTVLQFVDVQRKVIERHRKYIITAVIVLTGGYDIIAEYFKEIKEVELDEGDNY